MEAAGGKASEIAAKRVNRKQLLTSLSKKQGVLENSRLAKFLPNDFAEPDTREEDEAVIANAQTLEVLGKIISALCVNTLPQQARSFRITPQSTVHGARLFLFSLPRLFNEQEAFVLVSFSSRLTFCPHRSIIALLYTASTWVFFVSYSA